MQADRLNVVAGNSGNSPSSGSMSLGANLNTFGGSNGVLGVPAGWLDLLISGVPRKIPYY